MGKAGTKRPRRLRSCPASCRRPYQRPQRGRSLRHLARNRRASEASRRRLRIRRRQYLRWRLQNCLRRRLRQHPRPQSFRSRGSPRLLQVFGRRRCSNGQSSHCSIKHANIGDATNGTRASRTHGCRHAGTMHAAMPISGIGVSGNENVRNDPPMGAGREVTPCAGERVSTQVSRTTQLAVRLRIRTCGHPLMDLRPQVITPVIRLLSMAGLASARRSTREILDASMLTTNPRHGGLHMVTLRTVPKLIIMRRRAIDITLKLALAGLVRVEGAMKTGTTRGLHTTSRPRVGRTSSRS